VADNARPPVAVRIVRPYETEEAFLENELETVGKTSVILIGAHPRPTGVILRFEVTLASGTTVLRGEGRVLGHKENAFRGQPGLALRFTRLDPRSKALVDRAAAIREARLANETRSASAPPPAPPAEPARPPQRAPSPSDARADAKPAPSRPMRPSAPSMSVPAPDPVLAEILSSPTPPPPEAKGGSSPAPSSPAAEKTEPPSATEQAASAPAAEPVPTDQPSRPQASTIVDDAEVQTTETKFEMDEGTAASAPSSEVSDPPPAPHTSDVPAPAPAPARATSAQPAPAQPVPPFTRPTDREGLLARLRQRAAALTEDQVAAILGVHPNRS